MKRKKLQSKKSIGNRIRYTLLVTVIASGVIFIFLFYLQNNVFDKYNEYMNLNSKLGTLSEELASSKLYFTEFMKGDSIKISPKYQIANTNINNMLYELKPSMQKDVSSSIYFRTLSNMIDNFESRSNVLIHKNELDLDSYNEWMNLNILETYMDRQESQLTISYLNCSSREYSNTFKTYKNIVLKIYVFITLLLFICSAYTANMSRNIISVMKKLCRYSEELSNAHWEIPDMEGQKFDELNKLANTFNKMKIKIRNSIDELNHEAEIENQYNKEKLKNAENEQLLKETQLSALQSQMNPHFLFNTLNMLSRTAMFENADNTVKLVEATSKILRYNLDCKSKLVDLREELNMVRFYITIQKTRFHEQMAFHFNIDDGIEDIRIPPMTIQPIIENAIIHGLKEKDHGGVISISVKKKDDACEVSINDNGIGISQEDIHNILDHGNSSSLGIYNIKRRLEINFGRNDLLKIESCIGQGTRITISLPSETASATINGLTPIGVW
jgi:two-component system sensor histidine kinase YesM